MFKNYNTIIILNKIIYTLYKSIFNTVLTITKSLSPINNTDNISNNDLPSIMSNNISSSNLNKLLSTCTQTHISDIQHGRLILNILMIIYEYHFRQSSTTNGPSQNYAFDN